MIIEHVSVELDGIKNGIIVEAVGDNGKRKVISSKGAGARLFKNIEIAKVAARSVLGTLPLRYYIYIKGTKYNFDLCQEINDMYQMYDEKKNVMYDIFPDRSVKVTKLGYIVTEDGDTVRCDKQYGVKRVKKLLEYSRNIAMGILCENNGEFSIDKIERSNYEYILHIKNTTGKIHIITNSKLMDINQARKELGERCLPYLKEMDKFTTLYVYITKDINEPNKIGTDYMADKILEYIISDFNYYHIEDMKDIEAKFVEVSFNGYITLVEEDNND